MRVHINIPVSDLSASVAFYQGLFSRDVSKLKDDYANFRLDEPGLHLALVQVGGQPMAGDRHFGVELMDHDALSGMQKAVEGAGIDVRTEEQISCCYAVGDKFWATDPDGNDWEFWVRTGESNDLKPTLQATGESASCGTGASTGCCG